MIATGIEITPAPDIGPGRCRVNHLDCTWTFVARYGGRVKCPGCGAIIEIKEKK